MRKLLFRIAGAGVVLFAVFAVLHRWPRTITAFRSCVKDADCTLAPGCHPVPVSKAQLASWEEGAASCHCGPCRFAASHREPIDAWESWATEVWRRRALCPEDPASASIVCAPPRPVACAQSRECVIVIPDDPDELRVRNRR